MEERLIIGGDFMDYIFLESMDKDKRKHISEVIDYMFIHLMTFVQILKIFMLIYSLRILRSTGTSILRKGMKIFFSVSPGNLLAAVLFSMEVLFSLRWSTLEKPLDEFGTSGYENIRHALFCLVGSIVELIIYVLI